MRLNYRMINGSTSRYESVHITYATIFLLTLAACLLLVKSAAAGTSIVAERTPQKVVVAADGKATYLANGTSGTECKIILHGGIGFAESGISTYKATGFDSKLLAQKAMLTKGNLTLKERTFEALAVRGLDKVGDALFEHAPDLYDKFKDSALEVFFFGLENGAPTLIEARFQFLANGGAVSTRVHRLSCPGDCVPDTELRFLGFRSAINHAYALNRSIVNGDPENVTASLVQMEIDQEGQYVGPPVAVLAIDKSGQAWIQQGACRSSASGPK
jgi:hypothetical protein